MPFDQPTRNLLARFVGDARALLTDEFTRQLQQEYGLDPERGEVTDLGRLGHLDDARRATALLLRETLAYYLAGQPKPDAKARREALDRIVREQAFTILNRLCALRIAEGRGLLIESVGQGHRSRGFQLYGHLAGTGLGETGDAYRCYLFSLFDELALELPVLFDRYAPEGRLFPREVALSQVLALINAPEIASLWAEDETIGWIYQYFNSVEERRQMRAESAAPRNSRELAVRNQFFTPRYVVEFLTDNTLGRIWYEMTRGETSLTETCRHLVCRPTEIFLAEGEEAPQQNQPAEDVSQEELLRQLVYIPHRPLKDPRDILMLDPACGSLHFGLYSFDLYERIYDEAWELEGVLGAAAFIRSDGLLPLRESYPDKTAFLADVPRLIIERNIHGIDIDPRAVQIAGLSLWLRAQRSWQAQGIKPQDRPQIRRSNIVCAEPMPGDRVLLEEFLKTLRDERLEGLIRRVLKTPTNQRVRATPSMADALCDLVRTVWKEMELAGEAGSLLKIEKALEDAVARGKAEWDEKMPLFRVAEFGLTERADEKPKIRYAKGIPGEEGADFWDRAELLVVAALEEYSEGAENGGGYRRRLFAGDAVRGFAFIDLCRKQFDIVVMNPPFGSFSRQWNDAARLAFPDSYNDILGAFIDRFLQKLRVNGYLGAITSRTCFFLTSFTDWRRNVVLENSAIRAIADLGQGVMDEAMVEAAAYVLERTAPTACTIVFRAIADQDRQATLETCIDSYRSASPELRLFFTDQAAFHLLPDSPFVYWIDGGTIQQFAMEQHFEPNIGSVRQGLATGDDPRFVRAVWEVAYEDTIFGYYPPTSEDDPRVDNPTVQTHSRRRSNGTRRWAFHVKSGASQPWYSPITLKINWADDGAELRNFKDDKGKLRSRPQNIQFYYRPGFSWTRRAVRFYPYVIPGNCIPSVSRYMAFPDHGKEIEALGICASRVVSAFLRFYAEFWQRPNYLVETVKMLPWPAVSSELREHFEGLIEREVRQRRLAYQNHEPFHEFLLPMKVRDLALGGQALRFAPESLLGEAGERLVSEAFGFSSDQAKAIERDMLEAIEFQKRGGDTDDEDDDEETEDSDFVLVTSPAAIEEAHLSYLVGVIFGRWDIRFATGECGPPELADPFAPLPFCPPGMLQNAEGLPAEPTEEPKNYPFRISWPGVLVDDAGHPEDIEARARDALRVIWPANADALEAEACQILGVRTLREYFRKPALFFAAHLKRYSKSRRQAPIYWELSTPSGSYTLWLYYHRLTDQTLYTCVNDFVDPKLKQVSDDAGRLRQKRGRSSAEEKALEQLAGLELELTDFCAELLRIAAFWKPNLNDGVQITAAPLWRLFQHRPWQKTLKETWESLERGEYDWAHLAMSIWPERVVPKCVTDRSLAIAHDVEDLFWVEDGGRWRNLNPPDEELPEQVRRQQRPGRDQLRSGLAALTLSEGRGLRCEQVYEALATGKWDDLAPALLLWPERVAQRCWDDPLLAVTLKIDLPTKRTKAARERFIAERVAAGCPDLADALREALADRVDRFASLWAELARGDRDELALALALWPDRVVDECAQDVELAGRHGLRRFLWVQDGRGEWRRRKKPNEEVRDEVMRRESRI